MEIVSMMNVQVPSADVRDTHIVTAKFGRLYVPDDILTVCILITNFYQRRCNSIHPLPVHVQSIPRIRELYNWIRFKGLLEKNTLNGYP